MQMILGQTFDRKHWELRTTLSKEPGDDLGLVLRIRNHSGEHILRFYVCDIGDYLEVLSDKDFKDNVQLVMDHEDVTTQEAHDKEWLRSRPLFYFTHIKGLVISELMEKMRRRWESLNDLFDLETLC